MSERATDPRRGIVCVAEAAEDGVVAERGGSGRWWSGPEEEVVVAVETVEAEREREEEPKLRLCSSSAARSAAAASPSGGIGTCCWGLGCGSGGGQRERGAEAERGDEGEVQRKTEEVGDFNLKGTRGREVIG
jgi:hypothetical protein